MSRIKVAVLGGGPAAMAAAEALTATPELRDRYELTVHTLGWRLGGKCASGRRPGPDPAAEQRIEEHGLHIWFGFYDNAFALMQRVYGELGRPAGSPLATWRDAFEPVEELVLAEQFDGKWRTRSFDPPTNDLEVGTEVDAFFWPATMTVLGWLIELIAPHAHTPAFHRLPGFRVIRRATSTVALTWLRAAHRIAESMGFEDDTVSPTGRRAGLMKRTLLRTKQGLWRLLAASRIDEEGEADLRFALTSLDLAVTIIAGIIDDELIDRGFETVDEEEFRDWLTRHGIEQITLDHSSLLRALYDLPFAYEDGDSEKPNLAAGEALQALIRIALTYKGAMLWKMKAGMGDVVFTPLYEVLKARGVRFEFFTRVDALRLSPDGREIDQVEITRQAELADGVEEYTPLIDFQGLGCWPAEPLWDQLADGEDLKAAGARFESESATPTAGTRTLHRRSQNGGERDFDHVVLGISIGSLGRICAELATDERNPAFGRMLENSSTVATQAFQLWHREPISTLGWRHRPGAIFGSFADPDDTLCDMSHLIEFEGRNGPEPVQGISYFCGVLSAEEAAAGFDAAQEEAKENALCHLRDSMPAVWTSGDIWDSLCAPGDATGEARFDAQYWRANVEGSDLYVLTTAGSVKYRLWPHESGYRNLVLAGDWTRNGIDGGSVEAAVTSGLLAAKAISGYPERVPGTDGVLSARRESKAGAPGPARITSAPTYVDYGSLMTPPAPFTSLRTTLWGFWAQAEQGKLDRLCREVFAEPTGGEMDYRPLGEHIMITWGNIDRVVSRISPYDSYGGVREPQVAIWVPVADVDRFGPLPVAKRFSMFVPFIWLDNAMSLATGRELFGWPKAWGWPTFPDEQGSGPLEWSLDVFGLDYDPAAKAGRHDGLLRVRETTPAGAGKAGEELVTLEALARHVASELLTDDDDNWILPGLEFASTLAEDIKSKTMREVFLKQFRSVEDGTDASLQQVVEATTRVTRMSAAPLLGSYELEVNEVDSHPVTRELGLRSQEIPLAYRCEMDFEVGEGRVLWDSR